MNEPVFTLFLIASNTLYTTVKTMAPTENMYAAGTPVSLIQPRRKLFSPRQTPAKKLGNAKNFLTGSFS